MTTVSYFTLLFAATLWLSRFLLRFLEPDMFMDHPSERKLHDIPKPRFGGIAFGVSIIVIGWFLMNTMADYTWYFLGAIGIFIIGATDDYSGLSWRYKLPFQLLIGIVITIPFVGHVSSIDFFGYALPQNTALLFGLYVFWFIGILNAVNLIDGMDGLAGGYMFLTSFAALMIGWLTGNYEFCYINAIYMGAMAAFLHFNQKPAKFFMGDSGSLLLGYHLAVLPLLFRTGMKSPTAVSLDMTPFLLIASYLIIDTSRVFFVRIRRRMHPLEPDQSHLHHLMFLRSNSHTGTLVTIFLLLGIFGGLGILSVLNELSFYSMLFYLMLLSLFIFVPTITEWFVQFVSWFIHFVQTGQNLNKGGKKVLRVKFLPVATAVYFLSLALLVAPVLVENPPTTILLTGVVLIVLFFFFGSIIPHNHEILLIAIAVFQGFALDIYVNEYSLDMSSDLAVISSSLRYISIAFIAGTALVNYLFYSKYKTLIKWTAIDLLVLFLLVGLAGLTPLGIGIPVLITFELGVLYYANKLLLAKIDMRRADQTAESTVSA